MRGLRLLLLRDLKIKHQGNDADDQLNREYCVPDHEIEVSRGLA